MIGFDGASAFNLDTAKAAGAVVITGYTVGHPGGSNPIDRARVNDIRARGMGFLPNWERAADFFLTCTLAEAQAAGAEQLNALRALGVPDDGTVSSPFSTDVAVDPTRYPELAQKYAAVRQGLNGRYLPACYGQGGLINYLAAAGVTQAKGWLSGSSSFPGFDIASPNVCMVQSHDLAGNWLENSNPVPGTDINTITDLAGVRAWWADGHSPTPPSKGHDMFELIQKNGDPAVYAWSASGMWWHVPNRDYENAMLASKLCAGKSVVGGATFDACRAALATATSGANSAASAAAAVQAAVNDPSGGVLVRVAAIQAAIGALVVGPGGTVDTAALTAAVIAAINGSTVTSTIVKGA